MKTKSEENFLLFGYYIQKSSGVISEYIVLFLDLLLPLQKSETRDSRLIEVFPLG